MLKRLARAAAALALLAATVAGGSCLTGNPCCNACPLAKRANTRLATGDEAAAVSRTLRKEFVATVLANLEAI